MAEGDSTPKRARNKPENNGEKKGPELVPQSHGGALNSGGTPGNKGGTGRPPNEVRALARDIGYRSLRLLEEQIAKSEAAAKAGKAVPVDLILRISDQANKYGLGERTEHLYPQGIPFVGELATLSEEEIDARLASDPESREA